MKNHHVIIGISFALFGAMATLLQIVLLRALLGRFGGNELLLGMGLFSWLIISGASSLAVGLADKGIRNPSRLVALLFALFPLGPILGLWLIRHGPTLIGIHPSMAAGPLQALSIAFLVNLPAGILLGALFILFIRAGKARFGEVLRKVTAWEAIGAAAGGLLAGTLLIDQLKSGGLLGIVAACSWLNCLIWTLGPSQGSEDERLPTSRSLSLILGASILAICSMLFSDTSNLLPVAGEKTAGLENRFGIFGAYQRLDQTSIFAGSRPLVDCNDWEARDELTALVGGLGLFDKDVFLLEGPHAAAQDLLRLPSIKVSHVHPNIDLVLMEREACQNPAPADRKVALVVEDPRRFVQKAPHAGMDVLVINGGLPGNISASRLMTQEFFTESAAVLGQGFLLLGLGPVSNYISEPEANLLGSIKTAADDAFQSCRILPLDRFWLACTNGSMPEKTEELVANLKISGFSSAHATAEWLVDRLSGSRLQMLEAALAEDKNEARLPNRDLQPLAPLYVMTGWLGRFNSKILNFKVNQWIEPQIATGLFLVVILLLALMIGRQKRPTLAASLAIGIVAGGGISSEIVIMNAYQAGHGILFHRLGAMVAAYMFGLGLGAHLSERLRPRIALSLNRQIISVLAAGSALFFATSQACSLLTGRLPEIQALILSLILLILIAGLAGATFQLATCHAKQAAGLAGSRAAGLMRATDHLVAALAALTVSLFLLPVFSAETTLLIWTMLGLFSLPAFTR